MNTISPSLKTETELKALLPRGVAVVGLIPSIRIAADDSRERRIFLLATGASLAMVLAALAVIWHIRAVL
jgi:glutamate racemase